MITDPKLELELLGARTERLREQAERHRMARTARPVRARRWALPWRRSRAPAAPTPRVASSKP